ncbi:MAG: hypothetical protein JRN20_21770, partial [Nitrososphaerota archaeon]|nr:hypothetical protein [Nitrososphaerota archaeon]
GIGSALTSNYSGLLKVYMESERKRLEGVLPKNGRLRSILVHEQLTDLALALNADELIKSFMGHASDMNVIPGFVTRNFPMFVDCAVRLGVNLDEIAIMTPFNKLGFQMTPNRKACEYVLRANTLNVIAISVLASGQLRLSDAADYLETIGGIGSVVIGASSPSHARETFSHFSTLRGH